MKMNEYTVIITDSGIVRTLTPLEEALEILERYARVITDPALSPDNRSGRSNRK
jgi:hypothetical protein